MYKRSALTTRLSPLFILLVQNVLPVLSGLACFPACAIACCETAGGAAAFGGAFGIAVGYTGCAGVCMVACATAAFIPPACFASDTSIATLVSGNSVQNATFVVHKPISDVHIGEEVLTLIDGQPHATRVIRNVRSKGEFEFFEFELSQTQPAAAQDEAPPPTRKLKVTPQHSMLLVGPQGDMFFSHPEYVRVGDKMKTSDGSAWEVLTIIQSIGGEKYTLVTAEGSVLASGVLVSTICDDQFSEGQKLDDVVDDWKFKHGFQLYTQRGLPSTVLMKV